MPSSLSLELRFRASVLTSLIRGEAHLVEQKLRPYPEPGNACRASVTADSGKVGVARLTGLTAPIDRGESPSHTRTVADKLSA